MMNKIILDKIKEIEQKENVKVIFAVESGSRAWGFASLNSDYDVRFVYQRNLKDYLSIDCKRDVIEWQLDEVFDINGWDLKKALQLLHESNPNLFEWLNSPIVYIAADEFEQLKQLSNIYFNQKKCLMHYLNMAKNTYEKCLTSDKVVLKRYFYVLRALFASLWIVNKNTIPPVAFNELLDKICPCSLKEKILEMIKLKQEMNEKDIFIRDEELNQYIEANLALLTNFACSLESKKQSWDAINQMFYDFVTREI